MRKFNFKKAAKKVAALSLATCMTLASITGCGSKKKDGPIELTVFSQRANYAGEQKGWSAQVFLERFNVVLNIVPEQNGTFDTRMESGDLGDILVLGEKNFIQAMEKGLLFDWEEDGILDEQGSYIRDNMKYALEKARGMSADGKLYGMPNEVSSSSAALNSFLYTWDVRWDLYEQLGHPEVKDLDDLVQLFIDMKEICPTDDAGNPTYAVSLWPDWDGDMCMYVKSTATAYYGYDEFGVGLYNPSNGEFIGALDNGSPYIEMLRFYNKLYQNNLVDPDSMTQKYDQMIEKVKKGGTFFSIFNYAGYMAFNSPEHLEQNKVMQSLRPEEATPIVYGQNVTGSNNYWAIGSQAEDPELCMEILNWLATPEGRMTLEYGPQGVIWDYDDDGNTYFTEFGRVAFNDKSTEMQGGYSGTFKDGELQINCLTWVRDCPNPDSNGETYNSEFWKLEQQAARCDAEQDWRDFTGCTSINEYMSSGNYMVSPGSSFVGGDRSDELNTTWAQVTKCIRDGSWKAIYAESDAEFEQIVSKMIGEAKSYGYQQCWDWSNEEAIRRKAAEDAVAD